MFSQDQMIVYPAQGVGKIERIDHQTIDGNDIPLYVIQILNNNITVMVPVANASNVGLRTLCNKPEAEQVLASFQDRSSFTGYTGQNWNRRYREYSERLKSASLLDVAHVVKELLLISGEKDLSFGERRLLEQAMGLITSELAIVFSLEQQQIKEQIEACFADILVIEDKKE